MTERQGEPWVRPMGEGDLDAAMAIAASLAAAPHWPRSAYLAAISGAPSRIALVAARAGQAGEVAGFAVARVCGPVAELESIAIAAGLQGLGFGSTLLEEMVRQLRAAGVTAVELEVRAANQPALRLYAGAGFRKVGRRRGYYADPVEDAVLMSLEI